MWVSRSAPTECTEGPPRGEGVGSHCAPGAPRSELLSWFTRILVVVTSVFSAIYIYPLQNWRGAIVLGVVTLAGLLTPALYRLSGSLPTATHYFAAISFGAVVSITTFTGGLYSPAIAWLVVAPMAATMLHGPKTGGFWLGVVAAELILISLIAPMQSARMQTLSPDHFRLLSGLSLLGLSCCVFAALLIDHLMISATDSKLHYYATHDGLTGLLNHRVLLEVLERETAAARSTGSTLALIMIDVDHFKSVNDRYGHVAGDRALEEAARRISDCLRPGDFVGRYGGEEFLCILPDCPLPKARHLAESARLAFQRRQFVLGESTISVSISLGVAACADGGECDGMEALRRADRALYKAKSSGRNRTCVDVAPTPDLPAYEFEVTMSSDPMTLADLHECPI
jgi:diguanylate cyclase (GGDEF)-like protein